MTPQTGQQIVAIHVLPNVARSNGNQAVKFEYNRIQCEKYFC